MMRRSGWLPLAAMLGVLLPAALHAQEVAVPKGRIAGVVVDGASGRPVVGARVTVDGTTVTSASDLEGRYRTPEVPAGPQTVRVAAIGYQKAALSGIVVKAGQAVTANVTLMPAVVELEELSVEAVTPTEAGSEAGLLAIQQASPTVMDGVSSEEIAKSADTDASESVARIPGVSVVQDRVVVRGLGERYSATSLNGSVLPSPDPAKKVVPLDIFPTKLLDAVITTKTATPDRPADFTGGSVDIKTKAFPEQRVLNLSFSGTYNSLSTSESLALPALSGSAWFGKADASRALPSVPVPALGGPADAPETIRFFQAVRNVYTPETWSAPPNFTLAATYGDQLPSGALGWILAANYSTGYDAQANRLFRFVRTPSLENEPDGAAGATFQEASSSVDLSFVANVSAHIGSSSILAFRNLYTQSGTDQVYNSDGYNVENASNGYRTYQVRYNSRSLLQSQLTGDHILNFFKGSRLEWKATYAQAAEDEPDNRSLQYLYGPSPEDPSTTVLSTPIDRPNTWFSTNLTDKFLIGQLDLSVPFTMRRADDLILKAGGYYLDRNRDFTNLVFVASLDRTSTSEFRQLPAEQQMAPENIGSYVIANRTEASGLSYFMKESIPAAYGMIDVEVVPHLRLTGGVRYEVWNFDLSFEELADSATPDPTFAPITRQNNDLLPSVNVTWSMNDRMNLHVAYFSSVARPDGRELSPNYFAPIAGECSMLGNSSLQRTLVANADARFEFYPAPGEILSVGGFYKYFSNPIVEFVTTEVGGGANCQITPINASSAENYGLELNARKVLLRKQSFGTLDVTGNYTYVQSSTNIGPLYQEAGFAPPLVLQSPHLVNASIGWISGNGMFGVTVLGNYFADRIIRYGLITPIETGLEIIPDVVEQGRFTLDAKASATLPNGWTMSLSGQNLTNTSLLYTQETAEGDVPVAQSELGVRISLGVSYAF
jgi:hypothetical protein